MRTISVYVSDVEYYQFGLTGDRLSFTDFVELVSRELNRQTLAGCVQLAEKAGLSDLTMDEITAETCR
jgi:hypothetical protein